MSRWRDITIAGSFLASLWGPTAAAETLTLSFVDPTNDAWGCSSAGCGIPFPNIAGPVTDVVGLSFTFDNVTGAYVATMSASAALPFTGDVVVNVNLFNANAQSFFASTNPRFISTPTTAVSVLGTSSQLLTWHAGDQVSICQGPGGITPDPCPGELGSPVNFSAGVVNFSVYPSSQSARDDFRSVPPSVVAVPCGSQNVSGNADGTSAAPVSYAVGEGPRAVATGDFNADGSLDLVVANAGSADLSVLLGNGDGTFQEQVRYPAGSGPRSLAVGDFDGDHNLDLAVAIATSADVSILLGNGDGTFQAGRTYPHRELGDGHGSSESVAAADFNGDARLDLAVVSPASDSVSLLLGFATCNRPPVARCRNATIAAGSTCRASVEISDVDGGSSDPDGNPVTLTLDSVGPFGLGAHLVTLVVTDGLGGVASCQSEVTVVDRTPPRVSASLTQVRRLSKNSRVFRVTAKATDNCGVARTSARMELPSPFVARAFPITFVQRRNGVATVGINYRNERTTLIGPSGSSMNALLLTLLNDQGASVSDGQEITIINGTNQPREQSLFSILDNPRTPVIDGPLRSVNAEVLVLRVEAFDAAGNRGAASAVPSFQ